MQCQLLRAWELGPTTLRSSQVLSPNCGMNAYMTTLFGGEASDLCQDWVERNDRGELAVSYSRNS
jgi:hypothetical protein